MKVKLLFFLNLLILGSLLTSFIWYTSNNNWHHCYIQPDQQDDLMKSRESCKECRMKKHIQQLCSASWTGHNPNLSNGHPQQMPEEQNAPLSSNSCKDCRQKVISILGNYTQAWKKNEENHLKFRTLLSLKCKGFENSIITQTNAPLGSKIVYDAEKKRTLEVNADHFRNFFRGHPFSNKTRHTCAVVGNGGILANSSCGKMIDSAQFVIRCNLPPLSNGYEKDVGMKTDLVTANPSIFVLKYGSLLKHRHRFVQDLCQYGPSMLLLPAYSFLMNTALSLRAIYTIEDFESPIQPVLLNPKYLESLSLFWRSQGLKENRLSTGIMMTSLALELCDNVDLYGFWPFSVHPHTFQELANHYYDDRKVKKMFHSLSDEFKILLQLHNRGVLKLHLGDCGPG